MMMEAIWKDAGVSCEILVRWGDRTYCIVFVYAGEILQNDMDDGNQAPGYYVPPSKRTTEMVMGSMKWLREIKSDLAEIDRE